MKDKNLYLVIGQCALAISILLNHFAKGSDLISFVVGFLTGLSIVFNIAFFFRLRKEKAN